MDWAENIPPRLSFNLQSAKFSALSLDDRNRHEYKLFISILKKISYKINSFTLQETNVFSVW